MNEIINTESAPFNRYKAYLVSLSEDDANKLATSATEEDLAALARARGFVAFKAVIESVLMR